MSQTVLQAMHRASIDRWAVFEVGPACTGELPTRHLVGTLRDSGRAQVSTALLSFDPGTGVARTAAGTVYSLSMLAGPDFAARYVWAKWKRRKGVEQERDLTRTLVAAMDAALRNPAGAAAPRLTNLKPNI